MVESELPSQFVAIVVPAKLFVTFKFGVKLGQNKLIVLGKCTQNVQNYQGSISQRVRTSPNVGLVLGDMKSVRLVLTRYSS